MMNSYKLDKAHYTFTECKDCEIGQIMCLRPCLGIPEDMANLILAGNGHNLMLNYILVEFDRFIEVLSPANPKYQRKSACRTLESENVLSSGCVFQDLDTKLCLVHKNKPFEGKVACCKINNSKTDYNLAKKLHQDVINEWDSSKGREIVTYWKQNFFLETSKSLNELQEDLLQKLIIILGMP